MNRIILGATLACASASPAGAAVLAACVETASQFRAALALSSGADDVQIRLTAGTYSTDNVPFEAVLYADRDLEISGGWIAACSQQLSDPASSVLDGGNSSLVLRLALSGGVTAPTAYFHGFTIANGHSETEAAGGMLVDFTHSTPEAHLDRLRFVSNSNTGGGGALHIRNVAGGVVTLWNSLVIDNSAANGAGVLITSATPDALTWLTNNTLAGNHASETDSAAGGVVVLAATPGAGQIEWRNNALVENTRGDGGLADAFASQASAGVISTNNAYSTPPVGAVIDHGSLFGEAGFAGNDDYRLAMSSSLIDAGASYPAPELAPRDHLFAPRVFGAAVDIGAYEYRIDLFGSGFE